MFIFNVISKLYKGNLYIKDGSFLVTSTIINTLANTAVIYIFANFIQPETYGTYKYVLSFFSLLSITTLQGMGVSLTQAVSRGYEKSLYSVMRSKFLFGLLGLSAGLVISLYYAINNDLILSVSFLIISIFIPVTNIFSVYKNYLNGKNMFGLIALYSSTYSVIFFTILGLAVFFTEDVVIILLTQFAASTLLSFVIYKRVLHKFPPNNLKDPETSSYGKHLSFMKSINVAVASLGPISLWHAVGPAALPVYALAIAPIEQIRPLIRTIESLLLSKMSKDSWLYENFRWFSKRNTIFISLLTAGVLTYIIIAPHLYRLVFPLYEESVFYSQIFSVSLIFTATNSIFLSILKAKKYIKKLYIVKISNLLFDVLGIISVFYYGILGLVLTQVLSKFILLLLLIVLLRKEKRLK